MVVPFGLFWVRLGPFWYLFGSILVTFWACFCPDTLCDWTLFDTLPESRKMWIVTSVFRDDYISRVCFEMVSVQMCTLCLRVWSAKRRKLQQNPTGGVANHDVAVCVLNGI